jgi:hypothetical protein
MVLGPFSINHLIILSNTIFISSLMPFHLFPSLSATILLTAG